MRMLVVPPTSRGERWLLQPLPDPPPTPAVIMHDCTAAPGRPGSDTAEPTMSGPAEPTIVTDDLAAAVTRLEPERPRWVWESTSEVYPALFRAGVRVERCHDLGLTESLLLGHEERPPTGADAGFEPGRSASGGGQTSLFGPGADLDPPSPTDTGPTDADPYDTDLNGPANPPDPVGPADAPVMPQPTATTAQAALLARLLARHAGQLARIDQARLISPGFALLVAAESAAALAGVEMGQIGLPWRADVHDQVLTDLLGERPRHGGRPPRLQELAEIVARELDGVQRGGAPQFNIDSPLELLRAFRRQGVLLQTTRAHELKKVDHPAIEPLLKYKELARLHVAHGWAWRDQWVREGRFRPEYVPGGVVSGRWATKGGGALQIPKAMRASVIADPGWVLVVADAGQLEPRILAALSRDPGMVAATRDGDLYAALAAQALGRPEARAEAKIALLAAMYGARANSPAMAALRRRFPQALELLEVAARTGEDGGIVRSALGRTCPPPHPNWQQGAESVALARSGARGRFTRNFVIQASAADWANVLVAGLRRRLAALPCRTPDGIDLPAAELVLFQHDEVVVHAPQVRAAAVVAAIAESGAEATRLVVGDRGVRIPLTGIQVASYADKQ